METVNEKLAQWAIEKIKREYQDDVCLLIGHDTLKLPQDTGGRSFSYYIPATDRADALARTFIVDGIGYDLFPMSWERVEGLASLDGYNTSCLGDVEILYARSEEDLRRFSALQKKLRENLSDPLFCFGKALSRLRFAMGLHQTMLFSDSEGEIRNCAGHLCNFLSVAVALVNGTYFKNGQTNQLADLAQMKKLPSGFLEEYRAVVAAKTPGELRKLSFGMIGGVRRFLEENRPEQKPRVQKSLQGLADWYQELCYTWRRVYHWCDANEAEKAFLWSCYLHYELNVVGEEFGLGEMDLMGAWDASDLPSHRRHAAELEHNIVAVLKENGIKLDQYACVDEFLAKNG